MKEKIAKLTKTLRKELKLSQTELGAKVGVSAMAVSRWEAGAVFPEGSFLISLAKISPRINWFWTFLNAAGLSKADLAKKRA